MSLLIFVNGLGTNYKGDNIYEFIFSDTLEDIWDDSWDHKPSNGYPKPPDIDYISSVAVLKNFDIELELIQNSDFFSMSDSIDGVIALAWEKDNETIDFNKKTRLVFRYGDTFEQVSDKLYERDIILELENKLQHENK